MLPQDKFKFQDSLQMHNQFKRLSPHQSGRRLRFFALSPKRHTAVCVGPFCDVKVRTFINLSAIFIYLQDVSVLA